VSTGCPADSLGGDRDFAMRLENEAHDLQRIAKFGGCPDLSRRRRENADER